VDETGAIVGEGCPAYGTTRTEYFLSGTAPLGECYRAHDYYTSAWQDSLGYVYDEDYAYPYDDTASADRDEGFWDRLRERVFGDADSASVRRSPGITIDTMPEQRVRPEPDSAERANPRLLGEPVDSGRARVPPPSPPDTSGTGAGV
jgi:hypothetical protein